MTDANNGSAGADQGGGGFQAPAWLPGVEADVAKFITDKTVADLPSLAKGYVDAQKALSSRPAFEMPKEGDVEGLKKLHAALGVPDKPEYDFGEAGNGMADDAKKFWAGELHKLGIPTKAAQGLVGVVAAQSKALQEAQEQAFAEQAAKAVDSKLLEWGDAKDQNKDLATRGIAKVLAELKIENTLENRAKLERALGTDKFMDLGLLLGRQMVEAGFVTQDGQRRGLTKEGAQQELNSMLMDGAVASSLMNRADPNHAKNVQRKMELEQIAHG